MSGVHPLVFVSRRRKPALQRLGDALRRHGRALAWLQWAVVAFYAVLVIVPVVLPAPGPQASLLSDLTLFAQFLFWGVWWPFVILSVMLFGRAWCGLLCPEGRLTEFASRHGLGRTIPRWMRWGGWPLLAFVATTLWGQLVSVYEYPRATLLILGGSTLAAAAVGWVYGRGKRVWCRYLCPVSGVFALLAKLAPMHYRADPEAWRRYAGPAERVDCPPLLDLRHLDSASECLACGRCSGHREAIALQARWPGSEITRPGAAAPAAWLPLLLLFGVFGVALGAFQWSASPWLVAGKQAVAAWLVAHDHFALLKENAPWWLLTHEPAAHDVFNWLDGLAILAYIGATTAVVGGLSWLALWAAGRVLRHRGTDWRTLAFGLVPAGGLSLFVGLSQLTLTHLRAEGWAPGGVGMLRALVLALGCAWSAALGAGLIRRVPASVLRRLLAWALFLLPLGLVHASWYRHFAGG